ncbi:predicted protein [Verticillium alfalfae VaMs.102]|uniref:Predicted protein n=1 Tax=Verticillium alfalfae (strain VaMs.102 / ATCC MYA-4576 / FGSC 10136) TaxID=526221 RepID=C9SJ38_VERA1|nr:predicted protein [Verticillium alfalfae VaMs.102]EEY18961.1 predicted protein [Verticillium alfalfae VaMs.102]
MSDGFTVWESSPLEESTDDAQSPGLATQKWPRLQGSVQGGLRFRDCHGRSATTLTASAAARAASSASSTPPPRHGPRSDMAASIIGSEPPSQTSTPKPVQPRPGARRNNRTSLYHPPASAQGNGAPEVYWSEGATPSGYSRGDEGESYTFYREPTPEPQEKRRTGVGIDTPSDDEAGFGRWAGKARLNRRMCGLRAWVFWGIVALALIVLIGVGVGVGVGVGMSSGGTSVAAASEAEPSSSLSASPTTSASTELGTMTIESSPSASTAPATPDSTTASVSSDAAFPTATSPGSLICPESNYTLYGVPGSSIRFLRLCGVDYPSQQGAVDIRTLWTESMAECMRNCAGTPGCTGSGWGPAEGACWLKKDLTTGGRSDQADWEFALLQ